MHNTKNAVVGDTFEAMESAEESSVKNPSLFRNWALMSSIIVYCIFSLHDMAYTEVRSTLHHDLHHT